MVWPPVRAETVQQLTQVDQIDRSKRRPAAGHKPELIPGCDIGERDGDRAKAPVFTSIDNPVLAPVPPPADQLKLATRVRMKGVRDANLAVGRIHTNCSR